MKHLGSFSGTGTVTVGELNATVDYEIVVLAGLGGMKSAQGTMSGDPRILLQIFDNDQADLQLQTGETIKIMISNYEPMETKAGFVVSGPMPTGI